jgi:hypothetical protein
MSAPLSALITGNFLMTMSPTSPPAQATRSSPAPHASHDIPEWVRKGSHDCALQIAPKISMFCQNDTIVLRLLGKTEGEVVELEVPSSEVSGSREDEIASFQKFADELNRVPLVESALFQRLAAEDGYKIRKLCASGEHALIEGTLAGNAIVSGNFHNSILSLRGGPATFEKFSASGASTLDFDCPNSTFNQVTLGKETAFRGNMQGLTIAGPGTRIESYCIGLTLKSVSTENGAETLGSIFKGAILSGNTVDISMFTNATKELTKKELLGCIQEMNGAFANEHFGRRTVADFLPSGEQICRAPRLLTNSADDLVRTSIPAASEAPKGTAQPGPYFRIEFKLPETVASEIQFLAGLSDSEPAPTYVVAIPLGREPAPLVAVCVPEKNGERSTAFRDFETLSADEDCSLSHFALLDGILHSRGRKSTTLQRVSAAHANAILIGEAGKAEQVAHSATVNSSTVNRPA